MSDTPERDLREISDEKLPPELREAMAMTRDFLGTAGGTADYKKAKRAALANIEQRHGPAAAAGAARMAAQLEKQGFKGGEVIGRPGCDDAPVRDRPGKVYTIVKGNDAESGAAMHDAVVFDYGRPYTGVNGEARRHVLVEDGTLAGIAEADLREVSEETTPVRFSLSLSKRDRERLAPGRPNKQDPKE